MLARGLGPILDRAVGKSSRRDGNRETWNENDWICLDILMDFSCSTNWYWHGLLMPWLQAVAEITREEGSESNEGGAIKILGGCGQNSHDFNKETLWFYPVTY